jgi:hypothetical protein
MLTQRAPATRLPSLDAARLHEEIARIGLLSATPFAQRQALLELLLRIVNGAAAAYVETTQQGAYEVGPSFIAATARDWLTNPDRVFADAADHTLKAERATHAPHMRTP